MATVPTPGPLALHTAKHLAQLSAELGADAVRLNTKGEASLSLEHQGHRLAIALAVSEVVGVIVLHSYVGTVSNEDRMPEVALLLGTLNLSVADTGGTAMGLLPAKGMIYMTYSLLGQIPYESFRAAFARMVEATSAWRQRIQGDVELSKIVLLTPNSLSEDPIA